MELWCQLVTIPPKRTSKRFRKQSNESGLTQSKFVTGVILKRTVTKVCFWGLWGSCFAPIETQRDGKTFSYPFVLVCLWSGFPRLAFPPAYCGAWIVTY